MSWHTVEISPDVMLMQDGDRVVGSIGLIGGEWCVEVLWVFGDIKGVFNDYTAALAFSEGVEKTLLAIGRASASDPAAAGDK